MLRVQEAGSQKPERGGEGQKDWGFCARRVAKTADHTARTCVARAYPRL